MFTAAFGCATAQGEIQDGLEVLHGLPLPVGRITIGFMLKLFGLRHVDLKVRVYIFKTFGLRIFDSGLNRNNLCGNSKHVNSNGASSFFLQV